MILNFPIDLSKLSDIVKNDVVKKDVYQAKIKNIEDKITDTINAKINEVKSKTPNNTNLANETSLTVVENKIPSVSNNLVWQTDYNAKINESEKEITNHNHDKYITTPEFNKLTLENITARLKQANLASKSNIVNFVNKTDFDNKLPNFNKRINSNKTKHILVENELNELIKKVKLLSTMNYNFFLRQNVFYK